MATSTNRNSPRRGKNKQRKNTATGYTGGIGRNAVDEYAAYIPHRYRNHHQDNDDYDEFYDYYEEEESPENDSYQYHHPGEERGSVFITYYDRLRSS